MRGGTSAHRLAVAAVLVASISAAAHGQQAEPDQAAPSRVVGGELVPIEDYPWQVSLNLSGIPNYDGHYCGGSVIADRWILTAAHCVTSSGIRHLPETMFVFSGTADLRGDGVATAIRRIVVHPGYLTLRNERPPDNDIALIELEAPLSMPIVPLAAPDTEAALIAGAGDATVTGWGLTNVAEARYSRIFGMVVPEGDAGLMTTETGEPDLHNPAHLMAGSFPVVDNTTCAELFGFPDGLGEGFLCAGAADPGVSSCPGDSGGPLQVPDRDGNLVQIGVVSWGVDCAGGGDVSIYTRVAAYRDWIDAVVAGGSGGTDETDQRVNIPRPYYDPITLETDFQPDPQRIPMEVGGENFARLLNDECVGFVPEDPDFRLDFTAGQYPLFISASSEVDTVLMVVAPDGTLSCSDDYDSAQSFHPAVTFDHPQSGEYFIWVGIFEFSESYHEATLAISEIEPSF